jgi:hypothetical protein
MSEVISFRLNKENPREAKAIEILHKRFREGQSVRTIITEALIGLDFYSDRVISENLVGQLQELIGQVNRLIDKDGLMENKPSNNVPTETNLCQAFLSSVKKSVKPGCTFKLLEDDQ